MVNCEDNQVGRRICERLVKSMPKIDTIYSNDPSGVDINTDYTYLLSGDMKIIHHE